MPYDCAARILLLMKGKLTISEVIKFVVEFCCQSSYVVDFKVKGKVERDFQCQLYPLRSAGRHVTPLGHIILIQGQPVIKHQLYCFWLDLTGARIYDLRHLRRAC